LKTSAKESVVRSQESGVRRKDNAFFLFKFFVFSLIFLLFAISCAPRPIQVAVIDGISIDEMIKRLNNINSIETVLTIEYENEDNLMSGDASLGISKDNLNLRIYYLGFLVGEISERDGVITSKPKLNKNKSTILVDGIKNSLFWWNINDYVLHTKDDFYILENVNRKVFIDKKTLLPIKQLIEFGDGEKLEIVYDIPKKIDETTNSQLQDLWYNSTISFKLKNHTAKIKIKSYKVN
jgi:hypothetical protein